MPLLRLRPSAALALAAALAIAAAACGKKGPPLAPLHVVPEAPSPMTAVRLADEIHLRFTVPGKNAGGAAGPVDIAALEVYATSVPAGVPAPPNRDFLTPKYLVTTVEVRPAPVEGAPPAETKTDARPGPGEVATFVDTLTAEKLNPPAPAAGTPEAVAAAAATAAAATAQPPAGTELTAAQTAALAAAAAQAPPKYPTRIYAVRAVTPGGRPGAPSTRVTVPLVAPPPPPADIVASFTETAIALKWSAPPVPAEAEGAPITFNVYDRAAAAAAPLTPEPVAEPAFQRSGVTFGQEQCFAVRSVVRVSGISIESEPSAATCVTPRDTFPPAAPADLQAVSSGGVIALIWNANTEADVAGYIVLRGEAGGGTLQAITTAPIRETVYRDTTVSPGVRYAYAVVAVDRATPPNASAQSAQVEVTATQ